MMILPAKSVFLLHVLRRK